MAKRRCDFELDAQLVEMIDANREKLRYHIPRVAIVERAIAYYYDCLEDFVKKEGKFAVGKSNPNTKRNS